MATVTEQQLLDYVNSCPNATVDYYQIRQNFTSVPANVIGFQLRKLWVSKKLFSKNLDNGNVLYWTDTKSPVVVELIAKQKLVEDAVPEKPVKITPAYTQRFNEAVRETAPRPAVPVSRYTEGSDLSKYDDPQYKGRKPAAWYIANGKPVPSWKKKSATPQSKAEPVVATPVTSLEPAPTPIPTPVVKIVQQDVPREFSRAPVETPMVVLDSAPAVTEPTAITLSAEEQKIAAELMKRPDVAQRDPLAILPPPAPVPNFDAHINEEGQLVISVQGMMLQLTKKQTDIVADRFRKRDRCMLDQIQQIVQNLEAKL